MAWYRVHRNEPQFGNWETGFQTPFSSVTLGKWFPSQSSVSSSVKPENLTSESFWLWYYRIWIFTSFLSPPPPKDSLFSLFLWHIPPWKGIQRCSLCISYMEKNKRKKWRQTTTPGLDWQQRGGKVESWYDWIAQQIRWTPVCSYSYQVSGDRQYPSSSPAFTIYVTWASHLVYLDLSFLLLK